MLQIGSYLEFLLHLQRVEKDLNFQNWYITSLKKVKNSRWLLLNMLNVSCV